MFFLFFNKHVDALRSLWALISGTPCLLAWVYLPYRFNSSLPTLRHDLQLNLQHGCAWLCESIGGPSMLSDNQSQGISWFTRPVHGSGTDEVWLDESGRLFLDGTILPPVVCQLAVRVLWAVLCRCFSVVDVYHQTLSVQHGISHGEFELCNGNVRCHHFLPRRHPRREMGRRGLDLDGLRSDCKMTWIPRWWCGFVKT